MPPQDIAPEIADPLVERILSIDESVFLDIGEVQQLAVRRGKGIFTAKRCAACGELTFVDKLRITVDDQLVCIPCSGYTD